MNLIPSSVSTEQNLLGQNEAERYKICLKLVIHSSGLFLLSNLFKVNDTALYFAFWSLKV